MLQRLLELTRYLNSCEFFAISISISIFLRKFLIFASRYLNMNICMYICAYNKACLAAITEDTLIN